MAGYGFYKNRRGTGGIGGVLFLNGAGYWRDRRGLSGILAGYLNRWRPNLPKSAIRTICIFLHNIYFNFTGNYGGTLVGISKFLKAVKKRHSNITIHQVKTYLNSNNLHQKFLIPKTRGPWTKKACIEYPLTDFECDLKIYAALITPSISNLKNDPKV